jgi:hypothetical protein
VIYNIDQEREEVVNTITNTSSPIRSYADSTSQNNNNNSNNIYRYKHHLNGEINNNKSLNNNQQEDIELIVSKIFVLFQFNLLLLFLLLNLFCL